MRLKLQHVAHVRSVMGELANITVIAYEPDWYPHLKAQLTAERFKDFYSGMVTGPVLRYEVDDLEVLNSVAHGALGGGYRDRSASITTARPCPPPFWLSSWRSPTASATSCAITRAKQRDSLKRGWRAAAGGLPAGNCFGAALSGRSGRHAGRLVPRR